MSSRATYETMTFPKGDGTFTFNMRISSGKSYWTSPEVKLEATTQEEASKEAHEKAQRLREILEKP